MNEPARCTRCSRRSSTNRPRSAATVINGMIVTAAALLERDADPDEPAIRRANCRRNLCRCGTHVEIVRAVQRAARLLRLDVVQ